VLQKIHVLARRWSESESMKQSGRGEALFVQRCWAHPRNLQQPTSPVRRILLHRYKFVLELGAN
jgi:hypothetical protein